MSGYTVGDRVRLKKHQLLYTKKHKAHFANTAVIVADENPAFPGVFVVCETTRATKNIAKFLDKEEIEKTLERLSIEEMLTHPQPAIREAARKSLNE